MGVMVVGRGSGSGHRDQFEKSSVGSFVDFGQREPKSYRT